MKTIVQLAKELSHQLTTSERANEEKTKYVHLKDGSPAWMQDVIHKAHGDRMPDDDVYKRIETIVDTIAELDDNADDDTIQERIDEIEPDCYTSNLTAWLNSRNDNVFYLDEAIQAGITDGFQLLAYAQGVYIREIADALIAGLRELAESEDTE